jgi:RNA polymerase sigma factor (sigma-70 family)
MSPESLLESKYELLAQTTSRLVKRFRVLEFDDAMQIVTLAVWRMLERRMNAGQDVTNGLIVICANRAVIDELRSRRYGGPTRDAYTRGERHYVVSLSSHREGFRRALLDDLTDADDAYADLDHRAEASDLARRAMTNPLLPERERRVLYLRFYENMTLREISDLEGVTESRICQLLATALKRCRVAIAA